MTCPQHPNTGNQYAAKPASKRKDGQLVVRCKHRDHKRWKQRAKALDQTLSAWVVERLNEASQEGKS